MTQPQQQSRHGDGSPLSYEELLGQYEEALATIEMLERDTESLHAIGIYQYMHPLQDAVAYEGALAEIRASVKEHVLGGTAIQASTRFTFDNSIAKGRKMTTDLAKLMLRAYNAEAENCVRYVKAGNLKAAQKRLATAATSIARYAATMEMQINPEYQELRLRELELTADFQMKKQEEREAGREERARLREQQEAERELRAERERLAKERAHYAAALAALIVSDQDPEHHELADKLSELDQAIAHNDYRIANIRAGYVYVISNIGSFGRDIVKIGLTRRIDPMERVRELGSASVPFGFDVHALLFSKDAVGVEAELHRRFTARRVNRVNLRREYFYTTPSEVKIALAEVTGNLLEFHEQADAEQYQMSELIRATEEAQSEEQTSPTPASS